MLYFTLPILYVLIVGIPLFLLYDFGSYFLTYLRGVGTSLVLILELIYDYIASFAFFIRILVQGVRLVLMFFVYYGLQELVTNIRQNERLLGVSEDNSSDFTGLGGSSELEFSTYFFCLKL